MHTIHKAKCFLRHPYIVVGLIVIQILLKIFNCMILALLILVGEVNFFAFCRCQLGLLQYESQTQVPQRSLIFNVAHRSNKVLRIE